MSLPIPVRLLLLSGLALGTAALDAAPAPAQDARAAITVLGGGSMHDDLTPGLTPTVLRSGWAAGLQAETWLFGGRTGLRVNGQYEERSPESLTPVYAVAMADADLLIRLLPVRPGRSVAPYLVLGGGATSFFSRDPSTPLGSGAYGSDPVTRVHVLAGGGVDLASWSRAGLRLEIGDRIVFPSVGESPVAEGLPVVHNLVAMAGLQLRFGSLSRGNPTRPAPRAAAPRPSPGPAAAAPAAPIKPAPDTTPEAPRPAQEGAPRAGAASPATIAAAPPEERARFTVQLGSFVETGTAVRWAERLSERGLPVWLLQLEIQGEGVRRIRVGAATTEGDAGRLAEALRVEFGWSTRVDRIADGETVPPGALGKTRAYLAGLRSEGRP